MNWLDRLVAQFLPFPCQTSDEMYPRHNLAVQNIETEERTEETDAAILDKEYRIRHKKCVRCGEEVEQEEVISKDHRWKEDQ